MSVGSVAAIRDEPWTSGMATTAGQLVLRRPADHADIVFPLAWGSVTVYVGSMSDAATGSVRLAWRTSTESDNYGFEVERRAIANRELPIVNYQRRIRIRSIRRRRSSSRWPMRAWLR
ncbi:MAG: hypothetical protein AABY75_08035 [Bacteroidota bacterium]